MSPKPKTYHHGNLRQKLIRTAEDLITRKGDAAVTMRMLSRHIGVSHTAAYRHFKDKEELLCIIIQNGFKTLTDRFQSLVPKLQNEPLALIEALGKAYIDFALENPARYRLMFGHVMVKNRSKQSLNEAVRQAFAHPLQAIENGQQKGQIRSGSPLELASMSWSMVHGHSQLAIDGQLLPALVDVVSDRPEVVELAGLTRLVLDALVSYLAKKDEVLMPRAG